MFLYNIIINPFNAPQVTILTSVRHKVGFRSGEYEFVKHFFIIYYNKNTSIGI